MKTFYLIFLSIISFFPSKAQSINGMTIDSIDSEYMQIICRAKLFSSYDKVVLDFGTLSKIDDGKEIDLRNKKGRKVVLKSKIDALNFMYIFGYDLVESDQLIDENGTTYICLLRKKKHHE